MQSRLIGKIELEWQKRNILESYLKLWENMNVKDFLGKKELEYLQSSADRKNSSGSD